MKLKKALAALLFLSFLSSSGIASASQEQTSAYRKFVIYYGWYSDGDGRLGHDIDRIIRSKPEYVVSPYYTSSGIVNLTPQVISKFSDNGIGILTYIATGNAGRDLDSVMGEIRTGIEAGAAGVMLDEVATLHNRWEVDYYEKIYEYVKSFGAEKVVVANPGSIMVNESVMSVSDILCFEHQWRLASALDWFSNYPAERFMGISSNDITGVMGYGVDGEVALRDTVESWQNGIGYHYSTDTYTRLPSWFEDYQSGLSDFIVSGAQLGELAVRVVDTEGNEINGLWIEVRNDGRMVAAGFSPATFLLPEGSHQVIASNYQNYIFAKWQDGSAVPHHDIVAAQASPVELVAVYRNEQAELLVDSADLAGKPIRDMQVAVLREGDVVAEGKTPFQMRLPPGTYSVIASSSKYYAFDQWSDGFRGNATTVELLHDTRVIAHYASALMGKLGMVQCGADSKERVAESMLKGGTLGALLELRMINSVADMHC